MTIHITALGGGGNQGWSYKSDRMFAYGWIIDATTRRPVWEMTVRNTQKSRSDRAFDGTITLEPGKYEAYFAATTFSYHTTFTHFNINVDHRRSPLFGPGGTKGDISSRGSRTGGATTSPMNGTRAPAHGEWISPRMNPPHVP